MYFWGGILGWWLIVSLDPLLSIIVPTKKIKIGKKIRRGSSFRNNLKLESAKTIFNLSSHRTGHILIVGVVMLNEKSGNYKSCEKFIKQM